MSMALEWMIGADDQWCALESIDFDSPCFANNLAGVFVIWYGSDEEGHEGRVVAVGHGVIRIKMAALREDPTLCRYSSRNLVATWAEVDREHQASVEAYLVAKLDPIIGERHAHSVQTLVNLPPW